MRPLTRVGRHGVTRTLPGVNLFRHDELYKTSAYQ